MFFVKPKKKKNTALKVFAIIAGVLATAAAGYVLFMKVIKPKMCKKNELDDVCDCDEIIEIVECDDEIEVDETEAEEILSEE